MIINPTSNNILLKEIKVEKMTGSGLLLLSSDGNKVYEIVATGPDVHSDEFSVGSKVVSRVYNASAFVSQGDQYYVVKEEQMVAVLED